MYFLIILLLAEPEALEFILKQKKKGGKGWKYSTHTSSKAEFTISVGSHTSHTNRSSSDTGEG